MSAGFPGFANGAFELEMRYLVPPERTTLSVSVGQCPCAPSEFRLLRQTTGLSGHSRLPRLTLEAGPDGLPLG